MDTDLDTVHGRAALSFGTGGFRSRVTTIAVILQSILGLPSRMRVGEPRLITRRRKFPSSANFHRYFLFSRFVIIILATTILGVPFSTAFVSVS